MCLKAHSLWKPHTLLVYETGMQIEGFAAHTTWLRMRGLLGVSEPQFPAFLWIQPCASIHTIGMRAAIDVLWLSRTLEVLAKHSAVPPYRLLMHPSAGSVLEMPAGKGAVLQVGQYLRLQNSFSSS